MRLASLSVPSLPIRAAAALMLLAVHSITGNFVMAKQAVNLEQRVEQAFRAARDNEFDRIGQLPALGPRVAPLLAPYLRDEQADIRREAVAVLAALGGESAKPLLVEALGDQDAEIRERAARALYVAYQPSALARDKAVGPALRASVLAGNPSAAGLLLLGYFPDAENERALREVVDQFGGELTKLSDSGPSVMAALPARIALSQLGDREAREALLGVIDGASLAEAEFLLAALRDIDSPTVLHALKKTLDDEREIAGGLPSGAGPRRRLRDAAVDAFARRLKLKVAFRLHDSRRYSDEQIAQVRRLIDASLPR